MFVTERRGECLFCRADRLKALLLRNGITYASKRSWPDAHLRWLATLKMEHAAQHGFQEYLHSIPQSAVRIARAAEATIRTVRARPRRHNSKDAVTFRVAR